jgi:hypothetical protein
LTVKVVDDQSKTTSDSDRWLIEDAIAAGCRPHGKSMKGLFKKWDAGAELETKKYP